MSVHRRARCGRACSAADVGQSIEGQALELLAFLLGGALLGLMYDMLRPIRRAAGRGGGALDVLFCALGGALFFALAMRTGSGRMGTWSLGRGRCRILHVYADAQRSPAARVHRGRCRGGTGVAGV